MGRGTILVHITHEAAGKIGGIGAVLHGLFSSKAYLDAVERSIVIGPLFTTEGSVMDRLGEDGEVLYSSVDGLINKGYAQAFGAIESFYNVGIIYGRRTFVDSHTGVKSSPEVVLIDVHNADAGPVNELKGQLFARFGICSDLYEKLWDYEEYMRLAPVALAVLKTLGAATDRTVIVAHEYMGMPTALAAKLDRTCEYKTAFYAHEVATMRRIVEEHPGHDTMFYNVIRKAAARKLYVGDVFGSQEDYFKHPLVEASKHCDAVLAVGETVAEELRFLGPEFETKDISVVYNGIPAGKTTLEEKTASKEKLQQYCLNLLGYRPDWVFSHVTRLVRSKGLWRDLRVLWHIDAALSRAGKTAVMFMISTEVGQRRSSDIFDMEGKYGWPVAHREGWPDLSGGEAAFYTAIQEFNARNKSVKVVFINQFGFSRKHCGNKMPEDMQMVDIHRGTDVEFGQSIYEPFGISPLEPLTFGGLSVFSSVCGCAGFAVEAAKDAGPKTQDAPSTSSPDKNLRGQAGQARRKTQDARPDGTRNFIVADYTADGEYPDCESLLKIGRAERDRIEEKVAGEVADEILMLLPKSEAEVAAMIETGWRIAKNMSWDVVVSKYLWPALKKILSREKVESV